MSEPRGFQPRDTEDSHECFFCARSKYPPLFKGTTLCARCGTLCNGDAQAMDICPECDKYLDEKFKGGTE